MELDLEAGETRVDIESKYSKSTRWLLVSGAPLAYKSTPPLVRAWVRELQYVSSPVLR